ncbi:MAG: protein kinase [Chloroflexota bacterium]
MGEHKSRDIGPYKTLDLLGASDHNVAYSAMHRETGDIVMLRVLSITVSDVEHAVESCKTVLDQLSTLEIPCALPIRGYGSQNFMLYIATDLKRGGSLRQRIDARMPANNKQHRPTFTDILMLTDRMATALDSLHATGLAHGQLQPESILFDQQGKAFLAEIGLTRIWKVIYKLGATNSFRLSRYSAPELWSGERPTAETDQYALACIVYELLTGRLPFKGNSINELMLSHQNDVAPPPNYIVKDLHQDLGMVFWQAFAKDKTRRFSTVRAFYQELHVLLQEFPPNHSDFFTFHLDEVENTD